MSCKSFLTCLVTWNISSFKQVDLYWTIKVYLRCGFQLINIPNIWKFIVISFKKKSKSKTSKTAKSSSIW
ncbi:hypothetical protein VNO80_19567 [Phaseolus coccineus]|uniref:Uncharacterized protein n=1 Tax=Phaseolus coccineus TaxID=3886 RepID=A0AAN9R0S9_PHACN